LGAINVTLDAPAATTASPGNGHAVPYQPSWIDRVVGAVNSRRLPYWMPYLLLLLALLTIRVIARLLTGLPPGGAFSATQALLAALTGYSFVLIHYLDRSAVAALAEFRPL
jgi:hypothetical protein